MIILNNNLALDGFTVTPSLAGQSVLPLYGNDNFKSELLEYSLPPEIVGDIPALADFSNGPNIDIYGLKIKSAYSNLVFVPSDLSPFFSTIRTCVDNEFRCDPNVFDREFIITITRADAVIGQPHRQAENVGDWHIHTTAKWFERAETMPVYRIYSAADFCGTECYVGEAQLLRELRENRQPVPEEYIQTIPAGKIGVFTSYTFHRSPSPITEGRRTVFLFGSRPEKTEGFIFSPPMSRQLSGMEEEAKIIILNKWRAAETALNQKYSPFSPDRMREPQPRVLAA